MARAKPSTSPPSDGARLTDRAGVPAQDRELRARGRRTLQKLLDAGAKVFARKGYQATRVDDIVKAAKISHGTFYLYFANKEELFEALVTDVAEAMAGLTEELGQISVAGAGRDELRAWLGRFSSLYAEYGPIIRTWTEADSGRVEVGGLGDDVLGAIASGLASRVRDPAIDVNVASLALVAMIERLNYYVVSGQVQATDDELTELLSDIVFASVLDPDLAAP